jgi:hypothetical protein
VMAIDLVLTYLIKHKMELTLENYVQINWMGKKMVADLGENDLEDCPEELVYAHQQGIPARIQ